MICRGFSGIAWARARCLLQASTTKTAAPNAASSGAGQDRVSSKNVPFATTTTATRKKIGPGLKGLSKRGTFSVNGNKITDESLKAWIENGDQLMPPFQRRAGSWTD